MPRKIPFQAIQFSSADDKHPASALNHHGPFVNGWQSARSCTYPQELILQFESHTRLKRVQLLSHQSFIGTSLLSSLSRLHADLLASKIEFLIGGGSTTDSKLRLENARFTRLG
jgi:hypothetical protein